MPMQGLDASEPLVQAVAVIVHMHFYPWRLLYCMCAELALSPRQVARHTIDTPLY